MSPDMSAQAEARAKSLGFRSFSAYVQHLLRGDLITGGDLTLRETPTPYKTKKTGPAAERQDIGDKASSALQKDFPGAGKPASRE